MKPFLLALAMAWMGTVGTLAQTGFAVLTREHTDGLTILYTPAGSNPLELVAWQRDINADYRSNEVIFVVKDEARLTLPSGIPFGDAGQPMWILPQTQNANLLFLGVNSERIPSGIFDAPLSIRLLRFAGPGYFIAWQALGGGQFNIRIDTRDGLDTNDSFSPPLGSHQHFNWGFSSTGVYSTTWQVSGRRVGEVTNIASVETTFVFHVQPLPSPTNFGDWQKTYWPPGFSPPTTLAHGNPDGDVLDNLMEYAFATSPTNATPITAAPSLSFVTVEDQRYGALTFTRYVPGADLEYSAEAASGFSGWTTLTTVFSAVPAADGLTELLTVRDVVGATNTQRFYRMRVNLK